MPCLFYHWTCSIIYYYKFSSTHLLHIKFQTTHFENIDSGEHRCMVASLPKMAYVCLYLCVCVCAYFVCMPDVWAHLWWNIGIGEHWKRLLIGLILPLFRCMHKSLRIIKSVNWCRFHVDIRIQMVYQSSSIMSLLRGVGAVLRSNIISLISNSLYCYTSDARSVSNRFV